MLRQELADDRRKVHPPLAIAPSSALYACQRARLGRCAMAISFSSKSVLLPGRIFTTSGDTTFCIPTTRTGERVSPPERLRNFEGRRWIQTFCLKFRAIRTALASCPPIGRRGTKPMGSSSFLSAQPYAATRQTGGLTASSFSLDAHRRRRYGPAQRGTGQDEDARRWCLSWPLWAGARLPRGVTRHASGSPSDADDVPPGPGACPGVTSVCTRATTSMLWPSWARTSGVLPRQGRAGRAPVPRRVRWSERQKVARKSATP